ncbi:c38b474c-1d7b-47f4-8fe7-35bd6da4a404 [Thermothielavioides terrestris]|uniref:C38b474c-1d7b-47f4-8fe7-35bd6da4a404 n=1 Tax=Thermothielavioides terrestris TaxID=2587410 RepID=A0A3S4ASE5_9PEZI|nr:c38b474c-1d7b-47f4-8fe7-35bd6da4a404 [Thermothielavioides terrestris]
MASSDSDRDAADNAGTLPRRSLLILIWTCCSAAFLLVAVRTIIRLRSPSGSRRPSADDCLIFFALASLITLCVLETVQLPSLYYITGILSGAVPLTSAETIIAETENYLRFQFPIVILFWTVLWSVKASFLALYFRLFRDLKWYRRVWFVLAVFTFLVYGGCIVTLSLSCGPDVRNFFRFAQCAGPQHVWSSNFSVYFSTASDVVTDLCIMAMPLRLIYNIKVSFKQKAGLVCVFSLGFVMIVFSIIRANQSLAQQGFVNLTLLMVWSTLAASISVFVGTLPALKVLITTNARSSANRSGHAGGSSAATTRITSATMQKNPTLSTPTNSVALGSLRRDSHNLKAGNMSNSEASESQEEILVQRDVTVSYSQAPRPSPTRYHQRFSNDR